MLIGNVPVNYLNLYILFLSFINQLRHQLETLLLWYYTHVAMILSNVIIAASVAFSILLNCI